MRWGWALLALLALAGCREQPTIQEIAAALNERQVSHCLYAQLAVVPYGTAYLYTQSGQLNCEALWQQRRLQEVP